MHICVSGTTVNDKVIYCNNSNEKLKKKHTFKNMNKAAKYIHVLHYKHRDKVDIYEHRMFFLLIVIIIFLSRGSYYISVYIFRSNSIYHRRQKKRTSKLLTLCTSTPFIFLYKQY